MNREDGREGGSGREREEKVDEMREMTRGWREGG